jgi:hypothetical protein
MLRIESLRRGAKNANALALSGSVQSFSGEIASAIDSLQLCAETRSRIADSTDVGNPFLGFVLICQSMLAWYFY